MRKKIVTIATYATYIYVFVIFLMALFFNKPMMFEFDTATQVTWLAGGLILLAISLFFLRHKKNPFRNFLQAKDEKKVMIGLVILFIIQILFVSQFYIQHPYDAYTVYRGAQQLSVQPTAYFSMYPNNLFLLFLEYSIYQIKLFFSLDVDTYWLLVLINVFAIDVAMYLIYVITKRVFSQRAAAYALGLSLSLLAFTPWLTSVYSDTLTMPLGLAVFYFYLKVKDAATVKRKAAYAFALGIFAMLGYLIKPTAIFSGIAIIVIELMLCDYKMLRRNTKQIITLTCLAASILVGLLFMRLPFNYIKAHQNIIEYDASDNFPFTHWMMMGIKESEYHGNVNYGMYTIEDYVLTYEIPGKEARRQKNLEVLVDRLQALGLTGYLEYLWNKSIWIIGDGTFSWRAYSESFHGDEEHGRTIRDFVYFDSENYSYYAYGLQTSWFIVLSLLALGLVSMRRHMNKNFFIITCTIFGSILFILLFEGNPRYLLTNIGFFVIAGSLGLDGIIERVVSWNKKKNHL